MRLVTGKTNKTNTNSLSIQISLNGHSFLYGILNENSIKENVSLDNLYSFINNKSFDEVELFIPNHQFVAIPTEFFSEQDIEQYFKAKSLHYNRNSVFVSQGDDITIVSSILGGLEFDIQRLKTKCNLVVKSIFNKLIEIAQSCSNNRIVISVFADYIYIVARNDQKILLIETYYINNTDEIVDYLKLISTKLKINKFKLIPFGEFDSDLMKLLKSNFKVTNK